MLVRKFRWQEDEDYGEMGWMPTWMKGANVCDGRSAAHDILEHHPNMELGAEAEFHALGAVYWGRGECGDLSIYHGTVDALSGDFISILQRVAYGQETLNAPPSTRALSEYHYGHADEELREIAKKGVKKAREEWVYQSDESDHEMPIPHDAEQRCLDWMRRGYRYASRRYGMGNNYSMVHLFNEVARVVDRHKHADLGMELTVTVNLKRLTAQAYSDYPREYGY